MRVRFARVTVVGFPRITAVAIEMVETKSPVKSTREINPLEQWRIRRVYIVEQQRFGEERGHVHFVT